MNGGQTMKNQPEVLKLTAADINYVFRRSGLNGNRLSPYRYNAEQAATGKPSEAFKAVAEHPEFRQIAAKLLEPGLKVEYHSGGGTTADDSYYVFFSANDRSVLAQFTDTEGDLLLILFPDWQAFLAWWSGVYASKGIGSYQIVFPGKMEIETLICALHCIDIYRRFYLESMLEYRRALDLSLTTQDFVRLLKRSLASGDKRWLLPTLFEVTLGMKESKISLKPEHLRRIEELGFVSSDEATLTLAERSRIMGTEFIAGWMGAIGWRATVLVNGEECTFSRAYLAVTTFANHLVLLETGTGGEIYFRHQAVAASELTGILEKWMADLYQAAAKAEPVKGGSAVAASVPKTAAVAGTPDSEPSGRQEKPVRKFCGECGAPLKPGKKFCSSCGTAVC